MGFLQLRWHRGICCSQPFTRLLRHCPVLFHERERGVLGRAEATDPRSARQFRTPVQPIPHSDAVREYISCRTSCQVVALICTCLHITTPILPHLYHLYHCGTVNIEQSIQFAYPSHLHVGSIPNSRMLPCQAGFLIYILFI